MNRKQTSQITTGVLLIVLGLIFLAQRLDVFPPLDFRRLWPVALLVAGLVRFLEPREGGRQSGGAWMVFAGVLFLLHTYDIFRLDDSWPLFIVAGGVSILFGRRDGAIARPHEAPRVEDTSYVQPGTPPTAGDGHVR
jgi:hypothetical protein